MASLNALNLNNSNANSILAYLPFPFHLGLQTRHSNPTPLVCSSLNDRGKVVFLKLKTTAGEKFQLVWVPQQLTELSAQ